MKQRFMMFRRAGTFYCKDSTTGKQTSLRTKDESEAVTVLNAKNEAVRNSAMNLQIAQVYLQHSDTGLSTRTWQHVMETIVSLKSGPTRERWEYAIDDEAFDLIRNCKLTETTAEHFLCVLHEGVRFHQRLLAPGAQFRDRNALAPVADTAEAPMAGSAIPRAASDHV